MKRLAVLFFLWPCLQPFPFSVAIIHSLNNLAYSNYMLYIGTYILNEQVKRTNPSSSSSFKFRDSLKISFYWDLSLLSSQWLLTFCCCSVTKLYSTLCDPMDCSTSGFPVLEFAKFTSIELVMPTGHPLLLSIFPSIRVFSNESSVCIRWPKYWSFCVSISPSKDNQDWYTLRLTGLISFLSKGLSRVFSSTTVWKHQFFSTLPSSWSNSPICTWLLERP